ncbi:MAG: hypothetical protein U0804_00100 [Gemmataceae bacterium]
MIRVRAALLFAAGFALLVTSQARTQPGGFEFPTAKAQTPTPLAVLVLNGIDDPALVAELKLSDEQVKALVARRQAVWDEVYTTAPAKADAAARVAATDAALKKTLTEAQYKRAVQIGAQRVVSGPAFGVKTKAGVPVSFSPRVTAAMLKSYPELAGVIKLTDAQQKTLTDPLGKGIGGKAGGGTFGGFTLTPEQQASVKEFLGPVLEARWVAKSDARLNAIPTQPREISLLGAKDVRADAAITEDQATAIAAVREKWTKFSAGRTADLSPKEAVAVGTALLAETEKVLAATLQPAQATRLKQIDRQTGRGFEGFGTVTAESHVEDFYKTAATAKEFDITAEQVTAIDGIWAAFRGDAAKVFEAGGPVEAIDAKVKALAAARRAKAEGVLTTAQTAKVRETFGAPFTGSTALDSLRNTGLNVEQMRAATFGKYTTEFTQLGRDKALHAELKLTPEQVKQAEEIRVELLKTTRPLFSDPDGFEKSYADRSAAVEAGLKKLLTADQAKRFREIMLQARERTAATARAGRGISTTVPSAVAYPGVAEAIKLTAEQKKSLFDGNAPAQVLTAEQKAAITKMLGAPYTPAPVATALPRATQTLGILIGRDSVTTAALGLTPEQTRAIQTAAEKYQKTVSEVRPPFGGGGGPAPDFEAVTKTLTAAIEEFEQAATKVLTAEQKKRLPQVAHQVRAASNLELAITAEEVAKTLGLTAEQTARLAAIGDDAERLQALVTTHRADTADQPLGLRLRDVADERMMAVLTDAQRAKWREMTGEPVPGLRKTLPGRFGSPFGPGGGFAPGGGFGGGPGGIF